MLNWIIGCIAATAILQSDYGNQIRSLSSNNADQRARSEAELVAAGEKSLPALGKAIRTAPPESRARLRAVRARIEDNLLRQATPTSLPPGEWSVDELTPLFRSFGSNHVERIPNIDFPSVRPITINDGSSASFWSSLDVVCEKAGLRYVPASAVRRGEQAPRTVLFLAPEADSCPRSDFGPLRLELISMGEGRRIHLMPYSRKEREGSDRNGSQVVFSTEYGQKFSGLGLKFRLLAEPHLLIRRCTDAEIIEFTDEAGRSLIGGQAKRIPLWGGGLPVAPQTSVGNLGLGLSDPPQDLKRISRLKLKMWVELVERRPEPLVVKLMDPLSDWSATSGETTVRVLELDRSSEPLFPVIKFSVAFHGTPPPLAPRPGEPKQERWMTQTMPEVTANVLKVYDEAGRLLKWNSAPFPRAAAGGGVEASLTLDARAERTGSAGPERGREAPGSSHPSIPTEFRYYEYRRAVVQAVFDLDDVELP